MKFNFSNMTFNQKLAFFAVALGFIAMFMHDPLKSDKVNIDLNELALKVQDKSANIEVEELADWLIQKKSDFVLIDLRNENKYKEYNIPTSVNVIPVDLMKMDYPKTQKIVIYSDDNIQAGQAWFILNSKNYKGVYLLAGGLDEWKEKILFPNIPANATPEEKINFARIIEISKYFGGTPIVASSDSSTVKVQAQVPQLKAPTATAGAVKGKSKREGC